MALTIFFFKLNINMCMTLKLGVREGLRVYFEAFDHKLFTDPFQVSTVRARLEEVESEALAAKEEAATLREVSLGS